MFWLQRRAHLRYSPLYLLPGGKKMVFPKMLHNSFLIFHTPIDGEKEGGNLKLWRILESSAKLSWNIFKYSENPPQIYNCSLGHELWKHQVCKSNLLGLKYLNQILTDWLTPLTEDIPCQNKFCSIKTCIVHTHNTRQLWLKPWCYF